MAAYYKVSGEDFFYDDWEKYASSLMDGCLCRKRFFVKNDGQSFKLIYECFSKPENAWRMDMYASIKKIGQHVWNDDLEQMEGMLLGYAGLR